MGRAAWLGDVLGGQALGLFVFNAWGEVVVEVFFFEGDVFFSVRRSCTSVFLWGRISESGGEVVAAWLEPGMVSFAKSCSGILVRHHVAF
jgi:hypothetical protein